MQAFETHSIDYLLKPVEEERLQLTISKLNKLDNHNRKMKDLLKNIENFLPKKEATSIPYKVGDKVILIKLENVVYFEADNKYVDFYDSRGNKYLAEQSLKILEEKLPDYFIRISKSLIINTHKIKESRRYSRGKYDLIMDDINRSNLISGSRYSEQMKKLFEFWFDFYLIS